MELLYPDTNISKMARQGRIKGKAENIDMRFKVTDRKNKTVGLAHFYDDRARVTPKMAARTLDKMDGVRGNNNVFQFTDTKKLIKILSAKKKR